MFGVVCGKVRYLCERKSWLKTKVEPLLEDSGYQQSDCVCCDCTVRSKQHEAIPVVIQDLMKGKEYEKNAVKAVQLGDGESLGMLWW